MQLAKIDIKGFAFIIILLALISGVLRLFSPFVDIIVVALVIVELFYPIYQLILQLVRIPALASFLSTLLVFVFVFIPLFIISGLATSEIANLVNQLTADPNFSSSQVLSQIEEAFNPIIDEVNHIFSNVQKFGIKQTDGVEPLPPVGQEELSLGSMLGDVFGNVLGALLPITTSIISGAVNVLFFLFLLIITLIYLFTDYHKLPAAIARVSPLDNKLDKLLVTKFTDTTRAVIIGNFFVAMTQATAVLIPMLMMNIGAPVLLWMAMVLLSLIPVGAGLVFVPVGILLMLSGRPVEGIFIIVYGAIIINVIDAVLRPKLLKGKVSLHPLVIIFSVIGGIAMFGPLGVLYGPLLAVFFFAMMEVYNLHFEKGTDVSAS